MKIADQENQTTTKEEAGVESLRRALDEVLLQLASLSERIAGLEQLASMEGAEAGSVEGHETPALQESAALPSSVAASEGISEQEVLAISAAIAAWLGVHAHIRQIRLIRTGAWAQQGRVTIQASHQLHL